MMASKAVTSDDVDINREAFEVFDIDGSGFISFESKFDCYIDYLLTSQS